MTVQSLLETYYRLPANLLNGLFSAEVSGDPGYFRFGSNATCYGQCASAVAARPDAPELFDASKDLQSSQSKIRLPFDPSQVIRNLREEHYASSSPSRPGHILSNRAILKAYYLAHNFLPNSVRRYFQRIYLRGWDRLSFPSWPLDFSADIVHERLLELSMAASGVQRVPFIWYWPDGATSCLALTHDVETAAGRDFCSTLMDLDEAYGFKASFQVVPEERYEVPGAYVQEIRSRGFEFNIHDLNHDGQLYRNHEEFLRRAHKINEYVRKYQSRGFRAGAMYRNLNWYDAFEFSYDMSVPNVAHLEPQRGGCCTAMPYFIGNILELPLTTTQDYSLFHILKDHSIDLWKKELGMLRERNALMTVIVHPDYVISRRERAVYESLLDYLREMVAQEGVWAALPGDVDRWWRARDKMKVVPSSNGTAWKIEGPGRNVPALPTRYRIVRATSHLKSRERARKLPCGLQDAAPFPRHSWVGFRKIAAGPVGLDSHRGLIRGKNECSR